MDAREAVTTLAVVGVGVFVLVVILSVSYQGYAVTNNQIELQSLTCGGTNYYANSPNQYCGTSPSNIFYANAIYGGYAQNFSKYAGPLPNTYASNLGLAITALVLFVVIAIIAGLFLSNNGNGMLGG